MPFKVADFGDFGTSRKPVYDFLLVNNTNLYPISHRFQDIVDYWSSFLCRYGVLSFNTLVRGKPLNLKLPNLASRN